MLGYKKIRTWYKNNLKIRMNCLVCRGLTTCDDPICIQCVSSFQAVDACCGLCGLPLDLDSPELCAQCLINPPNFDCCLSAFIYQFPIKQLLHSLKYQGHIELACPITKLLAFVINDYYLDNTWPEAVLTVPLHSQRLKSRGFNQATLLANALKPKLHKSIDIYDSYLIRCKHTEPQYNLSLSERKKNIVNAFCLNKTPKWTHLAVFDDVVTTGLTVIEITKLLKKYGVNRIDVWTVSRTPINHIFN